MISVTMRRQQRRQTRAQSAESASLNEHGLSAADDEKTDLGGGDCNDDSMMLSDNSGGGTAAVFNAGVKINGSVARPAPKSGTLFSAVMSRSSSSNVTSATDRDEKVAESGPDIDDGVVVNGNNSASPTRNRNGSKQATVQSPTKGSVSFLQKIATPTRISNGATTKSNNNGWHKKSPVLNSPGGYDILKALADANTQGYYQEDKSGDEEEGEGGEEAPPEEWQDATVYYRDPIPVTTANAPTEPKKDLTDIMNAESNSQDTNKSWIVEATKKFGLADQQQLKCNGANGLDRNIPEPAGIGLMDWSLKKRLRLECDPGSCLPKSILGANEGRVHQLALEYLSNDTNKSPRQTLHNGGSSGSPPYRQEEMAIAKWVSGTMYYQHPAVHPLSFLIQSNNITSTTAIGKKAKRDLTSYLHGTQHSIHNRVRRPAVGCMGGLGASSTMPPNGNSRGDTKNAIKNNNQQHLNNHFASTETSLLDQRRCEWQEAFRSMYQTWRFKLQGQEIGHNNGTFNHIQPAEDGLSRCSFYMILPHQVILFRGGVEGCQSQTNGNEKNDRRILPMIIFSSTSLHLRSTLKSGGVNLKLFTRQKDDHGAAAAVFSEDMLNLKDAAQAQDAADDEGDAESVHAELDAIKRADDQKGKVIIDSKKRKRVKVDVNSGTNLPPLYVCGDDDCEVVFELLMNTHGLSSGVESDASLQSNPLDVPLLLCRSLGPCMHTTLRSLCASSRRDHGYMEQHRQTATSVRAGLELRGPILPCALRDLTCAMMNLVLLDSARNKQSSPPIQTATENDTTTHHFAMFLQAHEGECSTLPRDSTGSSSSFHFNGSNVISLAPKEDDFVGDAAPTSWLECRRGDFVHIMVGDISRKSVVSFKVSDR